MLAGIENVKIKRFGAERQVPCTEVLLGDEFEHSGKWWKLTLISRCFGNLDHDDTFLYQDNWYRVDRVGHMTIAVALSPNLPFGELVPDRLPPPLTPDTHVSFLGLQISGRE